MKVSALSSLIIFGFPAITFATESDSPEKAFVGYKSAILSQDGKAAVSYVTEETLKEYQNYIDWALRADRVELETLSFFNRFQVILIKHRVPSSKLKTMNGRELFSYAVDQDWIGKSGVIPLNVANFEIADNRAVSDAFSSGQKLPLKLQYRIENGAWKFDLVQMMKIAGRSGAKSGHSQPSAERNRTTCL